MRVLIYATGFEVVDDGGGFESKEAIQANFKMFGKEHTVGDARYGRFRIGRGQIMSLARTAWRSGPFQMQTDVRGAGKLGYHFTEDNEYQPGCSVTGEWYTSLASYELRHEVEQLARYVRYAPVPVIINNNHVNVTTNDSWDFEDDKIKVRFGKKGSHGLYLYSDGILVKELGYTRYGMAADVVTKSALSLNMARNEISDEDPLWLHVHSVLRAEIRRRTKSAGRLSEGERFALIELVLCEEIDFDDFFDLPLIQDCRGRNTTLHKALKRLVPWSACTETQARDAEAASIQGSAFVLPEGELNAWRVSSVQELLDVFVAAALRTEAQTSRYWVRELYNVTVLPFSTIQAGLDSSKIHLKPSELTALERAQRNALQQTANNMGKRIGKLLGEQVSKRKLIIGEGGASAWTDSSTYIAVERKQLGLFDNGPAGLLQLCLILIHEFTHDEGSVATNEHELEFYERFHDTVLTGRASQEVVGHAFVTLQNSYGSQLEKACLPQPKWMPDRSHPPVRLDLQSRRPSPLLQFIIDALGQPTTYGSRFIEIQADAGRDISVVNSLTAAFRANLSAGEFAAMIADFGHITDWRERCRLERAALVDGAGKAFANAGISAPTEDVRRLFAASPYVARFWLSLPTVRSTGVTAASIQHTHARVAYRSTPHFAGMAHASNLPWFYEDRNEPTAAELAGLDREGRLQRLQAKITDLVNLVIDPEDKAALCKRLFNTDTSKLLCGKNSLLNEGSYEDVE